MIHTVTRIKPFSLAKLHAFFSGVSTLFIGLVLNAVTVFLGHSALTLSWVLPADGQLELQNLTMRPYEILLLTLVMTVIVMIISFVYGWVMALVYNIAASIGGGIQVDTQSDCCENTSCCKEESVVVPASIAPVAPVARVKKVVAKVAAKSKKKGSKK